MAEFFKAGGAGMWPVLLFGFLAVAAAGMYVLRPERRYVALIVALGTVTATSGLLGFSMGMMNVLWYVPNVKPGEELHLITAGLAESMSVIVLALVLLVIMSLVAAVGAFRATRLPSAATRG